MTQEEKQQVKTGQTPSSWEAHPPKNRQKDKDARWTVKVSRGKALAEGGKPLDLAIPEFGYKNHVGIDRAHGFIRRYVVTDAATHDGTQLEQLLHGEHTASDIWADTAYRSQSNEKMLAERGLRSQIHRKKPRGRAMSKATARANQKKCSKVEHVFAHTKHHGKLIVRTIGLRRAAVQMVWRTWCTP